MPGDVLVADNGGRLDEACVGDLVALEAQIMGGQVVARLDAALLGGARRHRAALVRHGATRAADPVRM